MNSLIRVFLLFLILTGASTILMSTFGVTYGAVDYWQNHGIFFLIFISLFPRLTLLFSSVAFGGVFWWLGLLFAPRLLVAILATIAYWQTNPILVIFAWMGGIGGESAEKYAVQRRVYPVRGNAPADSERVIDI